MSAQYDPSSPGFLSDPYSIYRRLRDEDPVHWSDRMNGWILTRYEDVALALSDPRFSAAERPPVRRYGRATTMVTADPPDHTRLRRLVSKAFTARAVERLRPRIQQLIEGILKAYQEAGRMDIVQHLAYPLPVIVIAEMLGVPSEDRERFKRWASDGLAGVVGRFASPQERERAKRSGEEEREYFLKVIGQRRKEPGEDLVSALIAARERGQALSDEEVLDNCTLLITAGHETTSALIGSGTLALLRHPGQWQRLRREPDLIGRAVEELLRYDPPVQAVTRRAKEEVEIGGRRVGRGEIVYAVIGAANRDRRRFERPDELDIGRADNPHLAFGDGIHFCLGAPLARAEAQTAIAALTHFLSKVRLDGAVQWSGNFVVRGLTRLPVTFAARE